LRESERHDYLLIVELTFDYSSPTGEIFGMFLKDPENDSGTRMNGSAQDVFALTVLVA
jgi:hypothetical protein